jgi:hypothetical protein
MTMNHRSAKRVTREFGESGQNLIEFALLMPFVLLFIGAIIMLAFLLHARSSLQQGVREGARQAAVGATLTQVRELVAGNAPDQVGTEDVQWCHPTGPSGTRGRVGDPVTVYLLDSDDGELGHPFTLVPASGSISNAMGLSEFVIRLAPRGTARLEKSVSTVVDCPAWG